jgi:DNA-binding transcriptional regulator LsrR (DeoR family)
MSERAELLAQVAHLYYEDNLTQDEIARRIGTSRSTVSRMLQEARETGVVEITVHYHWKTVPEVERELMDRFRLHRARILLGRGRPYDEILRGLGVLAARYVEDSLTDRSGGQQSCTQSQGIACNTIAPTMGISWGMAVYSTVRALRPASKQPITVVQMVGAVGAGDPLMDGPDLARLLAGVYGGEYRYLHAPLIVEDARSREVLLQEPRIRETLSLARRTDLALVGIGAPQPEVSSLLRAGYLDQEALAQLRAQGVAGDICARHYDAWGDVLDVELNRRVVGVELEALHDIAQVIGVAGGEAKAGAILGALRGGHVNALITDDVTARKVLALSAT